MKKFYQVDYRQVLILNIFIIYFLISCKEKPVQNLDSNQLNRKETKVYGDSLKIEIEYHGDTVLKHIIDLKGVSDDGFDDSFSVKSILSSRSTKKLTCTKKLKLKEDGVEFYFCLDDVIQNAISNKKNPDVPSIVDDLTMAELMKIKNGKADSLSTDGYYLKFYLLKTIDFSIIDTKKGKEVEKVGIEQYETEFSGGYRYYLIGKEKDTLGSFHVNVWMN